MTQLDISKVSVSRGFIALREVGAILPLQTRDERREHLVPETELWKLIAGFLQSSVKPHLKTHVKRVDGFKSLFGPTLAAEGQTGRLLRARLSKLQKWHRRAGTVLPFISKFLGWFSAEK